MSKLIADLDSNAGKTPFQSYTLRIGLDMYEVHVPLSKATKFEAALAEGLNSGDELFEVLKTYSGERIS